MLLVPRVELYLVRVKERMQAEWRLSGGGGLSGGTGCHFGRDP